jgi:hypothetical protein
MSDHKNNFKMTPDSRNFNRREFIKEVTLAGLLATTSITKLPRACAAQSKASRNTPRRETEYPDWIAEARIYGLSIQGARVDIDRMRIELERAVKQGANVIEADSQLSDYLSEEDFTVKLDLIAKTTRLIHDAGMKVVWYIPSLEVITPNGRERTDSFASIHPDWLQLSFDRERRAVFYGPKVFWLKSTDESAWMCPNSPYRQWFMSRLQRLAQTGVDGVWIDATMFSPIAAPWGCADKYCRDKFTSQTGLEFPRKFDLSDRAFWRYVQWRHEILTEFIEVCRRTVTSVNPNVITIAEVVTSDHIGATQYGTEGSSMIDSFVVWEVEPISETTAMADADYDDWLILHSMYKYCRGAVMNRPSWAFCYGYNENDAQLVMASAVAAQNNPYELRTPEMTTTVGMEFRGMMYNWIANHSKQIYQSQSIAPVAILVSERNRDFLDAQHTGGIFVTTTPPGREWKWSTGKAESPVNMEYMGDYRGLSLLLFHHQIPTDIYPMSRVNVDLLQKYKVLILPYMAILTKSEKAMLLQAVRNGATLIVSGIDPGKWDSNGDLRKRSLWDDILVNVNTERNTRSLGKGRIYFWKSLMGREYLRTRDKKITIPFSSWLRSAGVESWVNKQTPVVIQPYLLSGQVVIHLLNYGWIGGMANKSNRLSFELSIPWDFERKIRKITQSEPQWTEPKEVLFLEKENKVIIPLNIGINALLIIDME